MSIFIFILMMQKKLIKYCGTKNMAQNWSAFKTNVPHAVYLQKNHAVYLQ